MKTSLKKVYSDFEDFRKVDWGEGIWIEVGRIGLKPFQDWMTEFYRSFQGNGRRQRKASEREIREAQKTGVARFLVKSWNVTNGNGEPLPCTEENVLAIINDPGDNPERVHEGEQFYADLLLAATNEEDFRMKRLEANAQD